MLLIDNTVIIEDKSMIAKMIAKNLDFVSPMIRTGNDAQIQRLCYHGWNTTESSQISFPSTPNNRTKVHYIFHSFFDFDPMYFLCIVSPIIDDFGKFDKIHHSQNSDLDFQNP